MPSLTTEQALEAAIEKKLAGTTREELNEPGGSSRADMVAERYETYRTGNGYQIGNPTDFNAEYALDTRRFWHFLETTQADELAKLKDQPQWELRILQRLDRMISRYGVLHVLRKGLEVDDAYFTLMFVPPLASSSEEVKRDFERNEFSVTRQVHFSKANPHESVDMVVFINGLSVATLELKNHWTGQTARVHGIEQYKKRDFTQPLFQFGRCVVHFAVDTDEIFMATRLNGKDTFFLPFNKGHNFGAGNPPNPFGHKTAYLWDEVLTRQSLSNIIQHFVTLDGKPSDPLTKRNLIFPRYHQLDVVRKLLADCSRKGVGQTYLIQHSAGSGKSNSITWTAYQLIETYPERADLPGSKGTGHPLFDSVIVVTDRTILDKQIRDNIKEFSEVKNIVAPAFSAQDLRQALESGKRIIVTTIQKFPFIVNGIADLSDKRFAVIIDEAHSSQSGSAHDNMNRAMGHKPAPDDEDDVDEQDLIIEAMRSRKIRDNASYFAFTATPKPNTLEKFGVKQPDGTFKEFHLYSMKQAIEEGFILDVLANYTTYKSYYEIEKSIEDNPLFDNKKAQKKLKAYVEQHQQTINTKAEIMIDHFIPQVVNSKKLKGKAKGMIVTQNIETAIRYYFAIRRILEEKGARFKAIIAFSGKKTVDGIEYTEDTLNGFSGKDIKEKFDTDEYRLLVVANKFLTGFDQPKLSAMYVDKRLQGVLAVQALSRLNRSANKLGKKTEDLFILDFFNTVEDIKEAFDPFYTGTTLSEATDVNVLHELKAHLDGVGVYEWDEVEEFVEKYFKGVDAQQLSPIIDTAADRFNSGLELADNDKADFKIKAKQFVKIYGQMASIMPFEVLKWEKLFWFLKFLIPKLIICSPETAALDELLESVDLSTYGLERTKLGHSITLDDAETVVDPQNPNPRGAHGGEQDENPLDLIIKSFNERYFHGWSASPDDQRMKLVSITSHVKQHPNFEVQYVNNPDVQNRDLALMRMIQEAISQQRRSELEMYKLYSQDEGFKQAMQDTIRRMLSL
ncbi:type I restriction endonuclease subunit R [Nibrella viscosa]|uniref:Type I restriction endonuclease subunit R n=1 Tax=Nibrella viscosa TaxID=1084524 RepID=A0ABP8KT58_9BACT